MSEYICEHCNKPIYDEDALLCLYCGEQLNRKTGFLGKLRYPNPKIFTILIIVAALVCFIVLMVI